MSTPFFCYFAGGVLGYVSQSLRVWCPGDYLVLAILLLLVGLTIYYCCFRSKPKVVVIQNARDELPLMPG